MNVDALRHAGIAGLANRGVQAFSRVMDRVAVRIGRPRLAHLDPEPPHPARRAERAHFFAGAVDPAVPACIADRLPAAAARVVAAADAALAGRFDLLGYRDLEFGVPPDWHLDPVNGRRAPQIHWSLIDPLDHTALGDHKVVWELNRHQWFIDLAQAWRLTGDARFADAFAAAAADWMERNPPGVGINWASSLEVAYRMISWCWALHLFDDAAAPDAALRTRMEAWVGAHALHVERYLSYYYSPNTHLTGEALGLFHAGTAFPELPGARRWQRTGARILADEFGRQVRADGTYFEQAACYQRYTAEIYLQFVILAARAGVAVAPEIQAGVQRVIDALLWLRGPDGTLPAIGDDDGGVLTRSAGRAPRDAAGVFAVAAAWFGRADYAWAAGGLQPEVAWLLGMDGVQAFDALAASPPAAPASRLFGDGGYAVMRDGWRDDADQLVVNAGPLGCPVSGGHGHADLLAVHCHAFGMPVIVDPGTGHYPPGDGWRKHFRESGAHSTVLVDGTSQAETTGPFGWRERPDARVRAWTSTARYDLLDAEHAAYRRLADPVTHRRRVLFMKLRYWLIVDDLYGSANHRIDVRFQFDPAVDLSLDAAGEWVGAALGGGRHMMVRAFAATPAEVSVADAWVSPAYGQRVRAPALTFTWDGCLPRRVVTLLAPQAAGDRLPLRSWERDGDTWWFTMHDETVVVDDDIHIEEG